VFATFCAAEAMATMAASAITSNDEKNIPLRNIFPSLLMGTQWMVGRTGRPFNPSLMVMSEPDDPTKLSEALHSLEGTLI